MRRFLFATVALTAAQMTGCSFNFADPEEKRKETANLREDMPDSPEYAFVQCEDGRYAPAKFCAKRTEGDPDVNYAWRPNCKKATCQAVPFFVHYMLHDNIGTNLTLHVEAFDNPTFHGAPRADLMITGFDASGPRSTKQETIFVEPGQYYFRAYMANNEQAPKPYVFNGMELVGDVPVGVVGAASGAQVVTVAPRVQQQYPDPVHITIDKLFKDPNSEPPTNAFLKIDLKVAAGVTVPDRRQVWVRLLEEPNFDRRATREFAMPSEYLLVAGRQGSAEFKSPAVALGSWFLFVFIDVNDNKDYDKGEPMAIYLDHGDPRRVTFTKDQSVRVELTLNTPTQPPVP